MKFTNDDSFLDKNKKKESRMKGGSRNKKAN